MRAAIASSMGSLEGIGNVESVGSMGSMGFSEGGR
jgi:hypothetical protein